MKEFLNFINGEYAKNTSGKTFDNRNPVDNSLIGKVFEAGRPEVNAAVAAAKAALQGDALLLDHPAGQQTRAVPGGDDVR